MRPTDVPGPHHQGDVRDILGDGFDLAIFHPPCTYLCKSGMRWLDSQPGRWKLMIEAAAFFRDLLNAPIEHVAVENPRMHRHAAAVIGRGYDQVIQPWMFGHTETKATALWTRGLPPLVATDDARERMRGLPKRETDRIHYAPPGPDRWKVRSTTFTGIASAMASQWGDYLSQEAAA